MGVLTLEVGYTSATTGKGDREVHKVHVVALAQKNYVMMAVKSKTTVLTDVALSSLIADYQNFRGTFSLHLQRQGDNILKMEGMGISEALGNTAS
jgi:hypothetical protein